MWRYAGKEPRTSNPCKCECSNMTFSQMKRRLKNPPKDHSGKCESATGDICECACGGRFHKGNGIRTKNPTVKTKAVKMFEKFNHKPATKQGSLDINMEDGLAFLGHCDEICYISDKQIFATDKNKGTAPKRGYVHEMVKPARMFSTADGKYLIIETKDRRTDATGIRQ
jgi:hypothetical protein